MTRRLSVSIPAVREGLSVLTDRLAEVGLTVVDYGVAVRVVPPGFAHDAVSALTRVDPVPAISDEQLTVLYVVAHGRGDPAQDRRAPQDGQPGRPGSSTSGELATMVSAST